MSSFFKESPSLIAEYLQESILQILQGNTVPRNRFLPVLFLHPLHLPPHILGLLHRSTLLVLRNSILILVENS